MNASIVLKLYLVAGAVLAAADAGNGTQTEKKITMENTAVLESPMVSEKPEDEARIFFFGFMDAVVLNRTLAANDAFLEAFFLEKPDFRTKKSMVDEVAFEIGRLGAAKRLPINAVEFSWNAAGHSVSVRIPGDGESELRLLTDVNGKWKFENMHSFRLFIRALNKKSKSSLQEKR